MEKRYLNGWLSLLSLILVISEVRAIPENNGCFFVDLRNHTNMGFEDELVGDKVGGWDNNTKDNLMWDIDKYIIVENPYSSQIESYAELLLETLDLPEGVNLKSLRIVDPTVAPDEPHETGGNDLPSQVEDDNLNGKLDRGDLLVFECSLEPKQHKVLVVYASFDTNIDGKIGKQDVMLEEKETDYLVKSFSLEAGFSKRNGNLTGLKYNGKVIPGLILPVPGYYVNSTPGGSHRDSVLKVGIEEGPVRLRISSEGEMTDKKGNTTGMVFKGYYAVYPDSRIDYVIELTKVKPVISNLWATEFVLEIETNEFIHGYGDRLYYIMGNEGLAKPVKPWEAGVQTLKEPLRPWRRGRWIITSPYGGPFLGVYSPSKNIGIGMVQELTFKEDDDAHVLHAGWGDDRMNLYSWLTQEGPVGEEFKRKRRRLLSLICYEDLEEVNGKVRKTVEIAKVNPLDTYLQERLERLSDQVNRLNTMEKEGFAESVRSIIKLKKEVEKISSQPSGIHALIEEISSARKGLQSEVEKKMKRYVVEIRQRIKALEGKGLNSRPVKADLNKAEMYLAIDKQEKEVHQKFDYLSPYQMDALSYLIAASKKSDFIASKKLKDIVKGPEGNLRVGVGIDAIPDEYAQALKPISDTIHGMHGSYAFENCIREDGTYNFTVADRDINNAERNGLEMWYQINPINVIPVFFVTKYKDELCTTTPNGDDTNIQWLYKGFPFFVPVDPKTCGVTPEWMKEIKKFYQAVAGRYKDRESLLGWSHWNEPGNPFEYYHPLLTKGFRKYLRDKYGEIERLNKAWSSGEKKFNYSDFEEIIPPGPSEAKEPSMLACDWQTFKAKSFGGFLSWITEAIIEIDPVHPVAIKHDKAISPVYNGADLYFADKANYKAVGMDIYPSTSAHLASMKMTSFIDSRRSANEDDPVWIGEIAHPNEAGPKHAACIRPFELKEWVATSFLHGVEVFSNWLWIGGHFAHSLIYADLTPFDTSIEQGKFNSELRAFSPLYSAKPKRNVAIYYPRLSAFTGSLKPFEGMFLQSAYDNSPEMEGLHKWFMDMGFGVDIIDSGLVEKGNLSKYKLLVIPTAPYMESEASREIEKFIAKGGVVITTSETGQYDEFSEKTDTFNSIFAAATPVSDGNNIVKSMGNYGKGTIYLLNVRQGQIYVRVMQKERARKMREYMLNLMAQKGIRPPCTANSSGIESAILSNGRMKYLMVINHQDEKDTADVTIYETLHKLSGVVYEAFSLEEVKVEKEGQYHKVQIDLQPHEVKIFPLE